MIHISRIFRSHNETAGGSRPGYPIRAARSSTINPALHQARRTTLPPSNHEQNESYFTLLTRRDTGADFWNKTSREGRLLLIATDIIEKQGGIQKFLEANDRFIQRFIYEKFLPPNIANPHVYRNTKTLYEKYIKPTLIASKDNALGAALLLGLMKAIYDNDDPKLNDEFDSVKFGYRLCSFLIEIGATKLAQKIDSFYHTPEDWKAGLSKSKDSAETLSRGEFEALAKEHLVDTPFTIGEHVGTGTYLDTWEIKLEKEYIKKNPNYKDLPKDAELVLQIVKPDIVNRSKKLIEFALKIVKSAHEKNEVDDTSNFIRGLGPILEFTGKNIEEETDLTRSKAKVEGFNKAYTDVRIIMPKAEIEFVPAMMFDHGKDHRVSLNLKGKHFADLKVPEDLTFEEKRQIAIAIVTMELYLIFSGKAFDHDRHDKNQNIEISRTKEGKLKVIIGNFDEQGLIQAPNKKQKRLLARIIMNALANSTQLGENILEAITNSFTNLQENPKQFGVTEVDSDYMKAVADAVLSLMNYTQYFGKGEKGFATFQDLLKVIKAVIAADGIDPVIKKQIKRRWEKPNKAIIKSSKNKKSILKQSFDAGINTVMSWYAARQLLSKKPSELELKLPKHYNER